jgi:membrane fusion protein, macrolide-specific efflux system
MSTTLSPLRRSLGRVVGPRRPSTSARRTRPWHLYLLAGVGVALLVLALIAIGPPGNSARTSIQVVTAHDGVVQSTVTGSGNLAAGNDLNLNFQTSGTLAGVDVKVGQHVSKGQRLATLDSTNEQLALDQAQAQLTAAEDQLTNVESGSTTGTTAGAAGSASSSTSSSNPAASVASAQAAVDSAQASVNAARATLNDTKLYAPISGTIASVASLSPGDSVTAQSAGAATGSSTASSSDGTGAANGAAATTSGSLGSSSSGSSSSASSTSPFVQIVNTRTMTMTVSFSESDVNKLKIGQAATVTPDALSGVELGARVTSISPIGTTSNNVVSYPATLTLDQNDPSVKPAMSAGAAVIIAQGKGVNVPNAAVTGTGSLGTVTVLRNGKQTHQQVVVGLRGNTRTQIISGLRSGDQLVIKTVLPPLTPASAGTSSSSGTLGGTGARPGGFGGGGGFFGGGGAGRGAGAGGAGAGATGAAGAGATGAAGAGAAG